eukprot:8582738-Pyramimonas_sp.AAC.1
MAGLWVKGPCPACPVCRLLWRPGRLNRVSAIASIKVRTLHVRIIIVFATLCRGTEIRALAKHVGVACGQSGRVDRFDMGVASCCVHAGSSMP